MDRGSQRRYAIVSPVRNEARYVRHTLESVISQSEPPCRWVVVDDGSTDDTASQVQEASRRVDYIQLVRLGDSDGGKAGDRLWWAAEAQAFNEGLRCLDLDGVDFVVKLDGDLSFGPDYFARLLDEFDKDPSLGIAGGHCYEIRRGKRILEWVPDSHVRGATKMYRVECFSAVGGIEPVYGWDTLDEVRAQMLGWRTRSFHLGLDHLKPTGSATGLLRGQARMGRGAFLLGYHPVFVVARSARVALARPYVVSGCAFFYGYVRAAVRRSPRVAEDAVVEYLRHQQMQRLRTLGDLREIRSMFQRGES